MFRPVAQDEFRFSGVFHGTVQTADGPVEANWRLDGATGEAGWTLLVVDLDSGQVDYQDESLAAALGATDPPAFFRTARVLAGLSLKAASSLALLSPWLGFPAA
jgi:hypothetical protein